MRFYYAPHTCALASHIALEEVGASYEAIRIDFASSEQTGDAYRAINAKARVPALVTAQGALTETPAILAFIAQSYPKAVLAPLNDAFAFAEIQAFNAYLCSTVHVAHAHRMRGYRWADEESSFADMRRKIPQTVTAAFEIVEHTLFKSPFVMGECYTICDPYLFTLAQWLELDGVDLARLPKVVAHRAMMAERPTVQRAIAAELA